MTCECAHARKDLILVSSMFDDLNPQLREVVEKLEWEFEPEFDALRCSLGEGYRFESIEDVGEFLSGSIDSFDPTSVKAVMLDPGESLEDNLKTLLHADSLPELREHDGKIQDVLVNERIESHFQPIVTSNRNIWGFECLMRPKDADGESLSPVEVIESAHQESLQFRLDRLCREIHLKNSAEQGLFEDYHICINFLPTSIYEPEFCLRTTTRLAEQLEIPTDRLVFEVVETEDVDDREHLISILNQYREKGFKVGLDDVGSGYANLGFLGDVNPDLIKIDFRIVSKIDQKQYQTIARSLVELGNDLDSLVLAEGVETEEQFEFFSDLGADLFQGYLLGRPSAVPEASRA